MCLTKLDSKPTRKYGVGYKLVRKGADGSYECFDHIPHAGSVTYPLNKWITDPNKGEADTKGRDFTYPAGFHVMLNPPKGQVLRTLIKVRFRRVVATQTEDIDCVYGPQVVARQVMNLGEV